MLIFDQRDDNGRGLCVWQQAPSRRVVSIVMNGKPRGYLLSLPHVLFRIEYTSDRENLYFSEVSAVLAAQERMTKKTSVYSMPFPNIDDDVGDVCMPPFRGRGKNLDELCKSVVGTFWSSFFNDMDGGYRWLQYVDSGKEFLLGDYDKWEKKTKSDPSWTPSARSMILMYSYDVWLGLGEYFD